MKRVVDLDAVLDLWAAGATLSQIARTLDLVPSSVGAMISRARRAGDPRAVYRGRDAGRVACQAVIAAGHKRARRVRLGRKFPATADDLKAAIAASTVPVTQCEPGAHAGWLPSWM